MQVAVVMLTMMMTKMGKGKQRIQLWDFDEKQSQEVPTTWNFVETLMNWRLLMKKVLVKNL